MKIALYCGEKFFSRDSWKRYPRFRWSRSKGSSGRVIGFSIGPILFWDGS